MEKIEQEARTEFSQGARNRKVFTSAHLIFGLPSSVFLGGAAMAIGVFFISKWWTALIVALIYFPPMYAIHKDDPKALSIWRATLSDRTSGWEAGHVKRRVLVVLSDRS